MMKRTVKLFSKSRFSCNMQSFFSEITKLFRISIFSLEMIPSRNREISRVVSAGSFLQLNRASCSYEC